MASLSESWLRPSNGRCTGISTAYIAVKMTRTDPVIYQFVERDPKRPPIHFVIVSASFVNFGSKIRKGPRLGGERLPGSEIRCHILLGIGQRVPAAVAPEALTKSAKWT